MHCLMHVMHVSDDALEVLHEIIAEIKQKMQNNQTE